MISLEVFLEQAKSYQVVPLVRRLFSGTETPISVFEKLAADKPGSFLLESAEQGVWSRYSFIGVNQRGMLLEDRLGLRWISPAGHRPLPTSQSLPQSSLDALELMQRSWNSPTIMDLPPLTSGLVGLIGWDAVRQIELLPDAPKRVFESATVAMVMFEDLVIVDHLTSSLHLVANIFIEDGLLTEGIFNDAEERLNTLLDGLSAPTQPFLAELEIPKQFGVPGNLSEQEFIESVDTAKTFVRQGDVLQVVLSQRFDV